MILERIELRHVGRFRDAAWIGPLDPGLNVLAALNEEGKSTLIRAAARGLYDRHTTRSDEIKALQPVGSDLAPEVTLEFRTASARFRLHKRFLHQPKSQLWEWQQDHWNLLSESDRADERVIAMLGSGQPGRGASKPEHWGLLRFLWARQGEPATWPALDGPTGDAIRQRLARVELDPAIDRLRQRLWSEFEAGFTPESVRVRQNSDLQRLLSQAEELERQLAEVRVLRAQQESQQERHRILAASLAELARQRDAQQTQSTQLARQLQELEVARKEVEAKDAAFQNAQRQLTAVKRDQESLTTIEQRISALRAAELESQKAAAALRSREEELRRQLATAAEAVSGCARRRTDTARGLDRANRILQWRQLSDRLAEMRRHQQHIAELTATIAAKDQARAALPALTAAQLAELENLEREQRDLEIQLEVAGLTIEATPNSPTTIHSTNEQGTASLPAAPDAPARLLGRRRVELNLPTWGRLVVTSGAREIQELEQKLAELRQAHATNTAQLGVPTAAAGRQTLDSRKELERELKGLRHELQRWLGDAKSDVAFSGELAAAESRLARLEPELAPWAPGETECALVEIEQRQRNAQAASQEADRCSDLALATQRETQNQLDVLLREQAESMSNLARVAAELTGLGQQQRDLLARHADGLAQTLERAQQSFNEAEARLAGARAKLPPNADRLPRLYQQAAQAAADATRALEQTTKELNQLEGALGSQAAAGLASREAELTESLDLIQHHGQALRRRGLAARLLVELIDRRNQAAMAKVLRPLEDKLSASFATLTNDSTRSVFLDPELQILGIGPDREHRIAFDLLSQGAREQLLLALRGAVAGELAETEPQLLILDDVLVNTDPIRQRNVIAFLEDLAARCQVLVLTCHPDRYAGIGRRLSIEIGTQ